MARPKEFDRNRALDKAMRIFWRQGYEATSIQNLVDGMGINRQSIYDTFGDKQALFVEALSYYEQLEGAQILQALEQPGSVKAAIRQVFQLVLDKVPEERELGCLMVNSTLELVGLDTKLAAVVTDNLKNSEGLFYRTLVRAQEQGELATDRDLTALARFLASSLRGLRVSSKAVKDLKALQDIVDVTLSVLD